MTRSLFSNDTCKYGPQLTLRWGSRKKQHNSQNTTHLRKKQQETALNGPECTAPEGATSITVTRPKRRTLGEVIAKMEMAVCVFVHVRVYVCSVFFASVWVGGGGIERHSVKRSFRNTLPR